MKILFVCNGNVGRSQAAEAYFNKFSKKNTAISAGINAEKYGNKKIRDISVEKVAAWLKCMMEDGLDISDKTSKQLTKKMVDESDLIVSFERDLPDYVDKKTVFWEVENPRDRPIEDFKKLIEEIEKFVEKLVEEIG